MKLFDWDPDKNQQLIHERGISFEEIVFHVTNGGLLDIIEHPNRKKYPTQRMFIVNIENYAVIVPFVETGQGVFLKTIIPSRKMTRQYLGGDRDEAE
jgi:uncharacterized DUF497 family protein